MAAAKTVKQMVKLTLPAGQASPSPPVGPRLGQMGVNIMGFCKDFNAATEAYTPGVPLTTKIVAYSDRTADFSVRSPPTSYLLMRAAGIEKGAAEPGRQTAGSVNLKHIYEIAAMKIQDKHLSHLTLNAMCKCVIQTASQCGIEVQNMSDEDSADGDEDADKQQAEQ